MADQAKRKTIEEWIAGGDDAAPVERVSEAESADGAHALPVAEPTVEAAIGATPEAPHTPAQVASAAPAPLYTARAPKVFDKDSNFMLKMKPELANKVERAFELRDPNVFASRQEMLQKMLAVALDAYIQSRS